MNRPLGLGLVGAGRFGAFCLTAYHEMSEIAIAAIADSEPGHAQAIAPSGARVYGNYRALLADPRVQIVAIHTPPFLHGHIATEAAQAGKHVFVEKPLATSLEEAKSATEAASSAGVQLGINYVLRHHPLHRLASRMVRSEALGEFQHWSLENFASMERLGPDHWFWDQARSGGIHVEHGVHFFDLCNHLAGGAPDEVCGIAQRRPDGRVDRVSAIVRYGDRILATFYHGFVRSDRAERTTLRLGFPRGHIIIEGWIPTDLVLVGFIDQAGLAQLERLLGHPLAVTERLHDSLVAVEARVRAPDRQEEYKRAIQAGLRDLVAAIRGEHPLEVTSLDGLLSLAVALAAREGGSRRLPALAIPNAGRERP